MNGYTKTYPDEKALRHRCITNFRKRKNLRDLFLAWSRSFKNRINRHSNTRHHHTYSIDSRKVVSKLQYAKKYDSRSSERIQYRMCNGRYVRKYCEREL
mmetsp:Transcript_2673/g.3390  ORF Transcript_2673/g.3390 Transcript_2673/m.3390 type:complete len:99 (+) Transcript_2673:894-1190(+)